jgi:hypothetical protein
MLKRIAVCILLLSVTLLAQSRGTPANLRVNVDANGYLVTSSAVQTLPITGTQFSNARLATDSSGNLLTTNGASSAFLPLVIGGSTASSTLTLQSTSGVGTSDAIFFKVGNNGATQAGKVNTSGFWQIGVTSASASYGNQPTNQIHIIGTANSDITGDHISGDAVPFAIIGRKARGTVDAPTQAVANDNLVQMIGNGWETTTPGWSSAANGVIGIQATENFTNAAQGTRLIVNLTPTGSITPARFMTGSAAGLVFSQVSATVMAVANVGANSCGTSAASIAGNQTIGEVTVGATSGTQCRITVPQATTVRFNGSCSNQTTAALCRLVAVSTTTFDLVGAFTAGDVVAYAVMGR